MRNTLLLMKNYLNSYLGSFAKKFNKGKYIAGIFVVVLFSAFMFFYLLFSSYMVTAEFIKLSPIDYKFAPFAMYTNVSQLIMIVLLTVILKATSTDKSTDSDLLMSMPFKKREIVAAKSLSSFVLDFALIFGVSYQIFIVYYVLVKGTSFVILIKGFLLMLILTVFSTALSQIISFILKNITKKTKIFSLLQTILLFLILGLFLVFNFYINNVLTNNTSMDINESVNKVLPVKIIFEFLLNNNWLYFIILAVFSIILFAISIKLITKTYGRNNEMINISKKIEYKEKSVFVNIFKKEMNRFFNFPMYIMNTSIGVIMIIGASIYVMTQGRDFLDLLVYQVLQLDGNHTPYIVVFLSTAIITTVCTTYCSISLEGKTIWILKAFPIDEKEMFYGKIMFNVALASFGIIISTFFMCLVLGFEYYLLFFAFQILMSFFVASLGLYFNLEFPKLDWDNEIIPVKQSMSIIIVMFIGVVVPILCLAIYLLLADVIGLVFTWLIIFVLIILLDILITRILLTRGIKLFKNID